MVLLLTLLLGQDQEERKQRLQEAADRLGGKAALGRALGYRDGAFVGQMLRGERQITEKTLRQLVEIREVAALYEAQTASQAGVKPAAAAAPTMQPILSWEHEDELPPGEFVMVPRLEVHLSAGHGAGSTQVEIQFDQAQPQAFRTDWIRGQRLKPKKLAAMTARGDSMEPTIFDGDSLLVDTSQREVIDKKVYALWYDGGERVKRLFRLPGGGLRIKSDNADYDTIELGPDYVGTVRVIGRVVHRSGTGGL